MRASDRGQYTLDASGAIFHEGATHYYILSASHVTNPTYLPRKTFNPQLYVALSDGTELPAEVVGDSPGTGPDLSVVRVSKDKVPPGVATVIPLGADSLMDHIIAKKETVELLGYPIHRPWEYRTGKVVGRAEGTHFGKWRRGEDRVTILPEVPGGFSGGPVIFQGHLVGLVAGFGDGTPAVSVKTIREVLDEVIGNTLGNFEFDNLADENDRRELKQALSAAGLEEFPVSQTPFARGQRLAERLAPYGGVRVWQGLVQADDPSRVASDKRVVPLVERPEGMEFTLEIPMN
ncbi:MAG: trypsin-like peptidase domain-containing protein, partial [Elusimicrobia bacterium]|nr:trypsin-like peptidase domain-containing protein [Elusimicrobiota bacterium]